MIIVVDVPFLLLPPVIRRFLYTVGYPWASLRLKAVEPQYPVDSKRRDYDKYRGTPGSVESGYSHNSQKTIPSSGGKRRRRKDVAANNADKLAVDSSINDGVIGQ
jgi:hypothetical protein